MNVLEKILEEIKEQRNSYFRYSKSKIGKDSEKGISERITEIGYVEEIIHSHMDEIPNCEGCSRRKWYQKGYEDGKKDNDWIPVEERLPNEEEFKEAYCRNKYAAEFVVMIEDATRPTTLYYKNGSWFDEERNYYSVVAWQPLPEPYKEK